MTSPARKRSRLESDDHSPSVDMSTMKRTRSDSRADLNEIYRLLRRTILTYQHPVTGLLPAFLYEDLTPGWAKNDAWVRDNVYSVLSIWGMSVAYKRRADTEDDRLKAYELEQSVVKLMRGLLFCMMNQAHKVEQFKATLDKNHSLHAKYSLSTCSAVVGDFAWGHLQIDAISLYLLILAEMTATGLQIIFTLDEVAFIQNLVFYIEEAYRIPDYGIWERGDKTNHGETELNASSIGMAKAALEAISELDLFGPRGSQSSVIHVVHDQVAQCATKLNSLLPRESSSKEIDAGLLTIISYPAFAMENPNLYQQTKEQITEKLLGKYGCKRFLRDGYQTVKEDSSRLHYEPAELKVFENIECEWPLFFILLQMDALIEGNIVKAREYKEKLDSILPHSSDGLRRVPELYYVPADKVDREYREPHSQPRLMGKKIQHMWSQSLYILCCLMEEGLLNIGEIDPLNRRLSMLPKPDTLVQVVLLAEDRKLHSHLKALDIKTDTIHHAEHNHHCPVRVLPARYLGRVYKKLGICEKVSLTGRPHRKLGVIATSQLYSYQYHSRQMMVAFTPSFLDHETFYLSLDNRMLVDLVRTDLAYLKSNWKLMGRPTLVLPILWSMVGETGMWEHSSVVKLLTSLASGYTAGVRIHLGYLQDVINTSSVCKLHFLKASEAIEILDIPPSDLTLHRSSTLLQHTNRRESLIQLPLSRSSPQQKKLLGSVRRSRRTPPTKRKHQPLSKQDSILEAPPTPDSDHTQQLSIEVARGYSHRRYSLRSGHLLSEQGGISPSPSSNYLKGKDLYEGITVNDVVQKLQTESNIFVQADYLHCLFDRCGPQYKIEIGGQECTVEKLLEELYQKAAIANLWSLVRHTAGMLRKSIENLGAAATDLLVRQKTFTVGQPNHEIHIAQPRTSNELLQNIIDVCSGDHSAVSLTQEILVYLAMFIRAEPDLFTEMLRLRIGLIQNVMISELSRAMSCTLDDAIDKLLDLSPFDLKHLLLLIFSSKEFTVDEIKCRESLIIEGQIMNLPTRQLSIVASSKKRAHGKLQKDVQELGMNHGSPDDVLLRHGHNHQDETSGQGHWLRRRRLDGALNRVPPEFYSNVWHTLEKCRGICLGPTPNSDLPQYPTIHETTPGELKFALTVESKLNSLPDPEYRQLVVEVLMVLGLAAKSSSLTSFGDFPIAVEHIINQARDMFLRDQKTNRGPAVNCCCVQIGKCGSPCSICVHFYDSAPSGRYGTMSYLSQAVADKLRGFQKPTDECKIS